MNESIAIEKIKGRMDECFLHDKDYPSELSMAIAALEKQSRIKEEIAFLGSANMTFDNLLIFVQNIVGMYKETGDK